MGDPHWPDPLSAADETLAAWRRPLTPADQELADRIALADAEQDALWLAQAAEADHWDGYDPDDDLDDDDDHEPTIDTLWDLEQEQRYGP